MQARNVRFTTLTCIPGVIYYNDDRHLVLPRLVDVFMQNDGGVILMVEGPHSVARSSWSDCGCGTHCGKRNATFRTQESVDTAWIGLSREATRCQGRHHKHVSE